MELGINIINWYIWQIRDMQKIGIDVGHNGKIIVPGESLVGEC